jgi:hypothetical protein
VLDEDKNGQPVDGCDDQPFQPESFPLVILQVRPKVQDDNPEPIERVEDDEKGDDDLENPGLVNRVDRRRPAASCLLDEKRGEDVKASKNDDSNTGDPVEHPGDHWGSTLVFETLEEADVPFEAHGKLLVESPIELFVAGLRFHYFIFQPK